MGALARQPDAKRYLGPDRPWTIPQPREHTFRALNALPPQQWKVVIVGQDPYPVRRAPGSVDGRGVRC